MLTPGRTAPAESFTVPMIVPVVTCAIAMPPKSNRQKKHLNASCLRIMRCSSPILLTKNSSSLSAGRSWEDRNKTKRICRGCYNNTEPPRQGLFVTVGAVYDRPQCRKRDMAVIDRPYSLYLPCGSRGPGRAGRDGIHAQ